MSFFSAVDETSLIPVPLVEKSNANDIDKSVDEMSETNETFASTDQANNLNNSMNVNKDPRQSPPFTKLTETTKTSAVSQRPKKFPSNWIWPPLPIPSPPPSPKISKTLDESVNVTMSPRQFPREAEVSETTLEYEGQCKHCLETFDSKNLLVSHILSKHSNERTTNPQIEENNDDILKSKDSKKDEEEDFQPSSAFPDEDELEIPTKMNKDDAKSDSISEISKRQKKRKTSSIDLPPPKKTYNIRLN